MHATQNDVQSSISPYTFGKLVIVDCKFHAFFCLLTVEFFVWPMTGKFLETLTVDFQFLPSLRSPYSKYVCDTPLIIIIIISFASLALEGVHRRLGLYRVLTHSQGNLDAKGEPRTTNTGQIMYRKNYSKAGLEP